MVNHSVLICLIIPLLYPHWNLQVSVEALDSGGGVACRLIFTGILTVLRISIALVLAEIQW